MPPEGLLRLAVVSIPILDWSCPMGINLALANIASNWGKTVLSLAGIGVAILLIFMQLGFRGAVADTATNIYSRLDFDLLVRSRNYLHFIDAGTISPHICDEISSVAGVQSVKRLSVAVTSWRNATGEFKGLLLLGVDQANQPFQDSAIAGQLSSLLATDSLLIDRKTHREFSPFDGHRFSEMDIGRTVYVTEQPLKIDGVFEMGAGLASNGAAIVSQETFYRLITLFRGERVTFGLIKLVPGADLSTVRSQLQQRFAVTHQAFDTYSVDILDRPAVIRWELDRWMGETPIGFIFSLGVTLAFLVGAAIVYMVLGNDVANRLNEYATLRAMGFSNLFLAFVVIRQAIYLALFAFFPTLLIAAGLYRLTSLLAGIDLQMSLMRVVFVFLLTLLMCCLSGGLALRKLWQVAPADLF
jgi:putative ABC transport system permease protein